ncbi:MAG: cobalamin B12-binding domain-containing protein [Elusimicrobia bacterium]|nr:cobalamin B12-binding domain-containing protein [Elusimicrobiota bacterium]
MTKPKLIYLADLTHTCQSVASNVFPFGIGLLNSYLNLQREGQYRVELFKYPADLNEALKREMPDIMGFSNYSWNVIISSEYAKRIKKDSPKTTVIFGGPNYGMTDLEVAAFWARFPWIDFHVVKEGEKSFVGLLDELAAAGWDAKALRSTGKQLPSVHYLEKGKVIQGPILPRITNLSEAGSPYTQGLMDKFFDDVLIPMLHTTRGCPFSCTFCAEGNSYYNKVAQQDLVQFEAELDYIAQRVKKIEWLWFTDANFGMFAEDIEKAKIIARTKEKYSWPKRVFSATGKNRKERVIEVAGILQGSMTLFASLQTTDEQILKNIKRSNISQDALNEMVAKSERADSETLTELILALPGDTVQTHLRSLKDSVDANLGNVRMYQMILLPQTEMSTPASREQYGIKTKYRLQQRSFGKYSYLDSELVAAENEEICVSTNTMSFEDYLKCREADFTVEILHNSGMFLELMGLCRWAGLSWFEFIYRAYQAIRSSDSELNKLYDGFRQDSVRGLWDSAEELEAHAAANMGELLADEGGTNEIVKGKATAVLSYQRELHDLLYSEMEKVLHEKGLGGGVLAEYLGEIKQLSLMRKQDFLQTDMAFTSTLHFNYEGLSDSKFRLDPESVWSSKPVSVRIHHTAEQKKAIADYIHQYGQAVEGVGRILMRAPIRRLFRSVDYVA